MKSNSPNSTSTRKVYYRNSQFSNFLLAGMLVLMIILLQPPPVLTILFSFLAALMAYSAIQIRLVISPEGIEYYQVGYSVITTWSNVARVGEIPAGRIMAEGLILYEPAIFIDKWLSGFKYIQTRGKLIPLSLFKRDWLDSDLGQDINKYAPHLFTRM